MKSLLTFLIGLISALGAFCSETVDFKVGEGAFLLDGKPFVIKAAELHYPRIPPEYWEHRIEMCKALGMNTVCLYTFWNLHEPRPGEYNFSGGSDLRSFIELCAKHDLKVILRPGPYVCAEWEMGGLPWWLLKNKDVALREYDPYFLERVDLFEEQVAAQVGDLTADKGGPIIMIQVENEYGSYGEDKRYVAAVRDIVRKHFGEGITLFQCDWASNFELNGLDDLLWTMNFGTGADVPEQFRRLKELRPDSPLMCSEYWSGWFDKWGANHETRPAADMVSGIHEMLDAGISFSLYMTHGGTNRGHWAGANSPGFAPDVTSYDYDAPINEQGAPTHKYFLLRDLLADYAADSLPPLPASIPVMSIPEIAFSQVSPLFDNLPPVVKDSILRPMEMYDQGFGSIMYSTSTPLTTGSSTLTVTEPHDYAQIFLDGRLIGTLDRRLNQTTLQLPRLTAGARLDILVEAMGRINFGRAIKDYKGISETVTLSGSIEGKDSTITLKDWEVRLFPDDYSFYTSLPLSSINHLSGGSERVPGVYKALFMLEDTADTFLDFSGFGKGVAYLNGHALGRFWEIGPQQTIYVPAPWLKIGENELLVFDIVGPAHAVSQGLDTPIIDMLRNSQAGVNTDGVSMDIDGLTPVAEAFLAEGNGWQTITFDHPARGRYLIVEALDAIDGGEVASIAELYLLDEQAHRLSREKWSAVYADSSDLPANHTPDKLFDLQESTYWRTLPGQSFPHIAVIDLGTSVQVSAMQLLPRAEPRAPESIKTLRVYLSETSPVK